MSVNKSRKLPDDLRRRLTEGDCAVERTLPELNNWWDEKSYELASAGLKWWHEDRVVKKFREEIFPIKSLLNLFCPDSMKSIRLLMDSTPGIDAVIQLNNGKSINIEVTQCKDGSAESARKQRMKECGHVPALGPVDISGTDRKGKQISFTDMAVSLDDEVLKSQQHVLEGLDRKKGQKRSSQTWIVLVFQDDGLFDEGDKRNMELFYDQKINQYNNDHEKFFLLASNGKFCVCGDPFIGEYKCQN